MTQEDQTILELYSRGFGWKEIASRLPGRHGKQIRERYVNKLDPRLKHTPWTKEEDNILFDLHSKLGNQWVEIGKFLPGRAINSIKNRYHNHRRMVERHRKRAAMLEQHESTAEVAAEANSSGAAKKTDGNVERNEDPESS